MEGGLAEPRVVVSVHDVAPSTIDGTRWLLSRLDGIGARPRVLKVVPLEDGRGDLREHADLVELLTSEAAHGAEIVLHGLTHRADGPPRGRRTDRLRARLFAGDSAEFLAIDPGEARARLETGLAILEAVGLRSAGFCPPGWLARPGLEWPMRELGLRYFVTFASIVDLVRGRRYLIPALGYMGAGVTQERLVAVEGRLVLALGGRRPTLRLFLHPQGASRAPSCARALRTLERLVGSRRCVTYTDVLDA